jgi:hypothetical protein
VIRSFLSAGVLLTLALAAPPSRASTLPATASSCQGFRAWFAQQPGSQLVLSATNDNFNQQFATPLKRDNILDFSATPGGNDTTFWYNAMKHYRTNVGNGRCFSAFYDAATKTALVLSEYGTGSDLTITSASNPPTQLPIRPAPKRTQNGVRLGMTLAQVRAIDGPGTLRSDGRYQRLMYSQDITKTPTFSVTNYVGFLFRNGKVVAADVGGGV